MDPLLIAHPPVASTAASNLGGRLDAHTPVPW